MDGMNAANLLEAKSAILGAVFDFLKIGMSTEEIQAMLVGILKSRGHDAMIPISLLWAAEYIAKKQSNEAPAVSPQVEP